MYGVIASMYGVIASMYGVVASMYGVIGHGRGGMSDEYEVLAAEYLAEEKGKLRAVATLGTTVPTV